MKKTGIVAMLSLVVIALAQTSGAQAPTSTSNWLCYSDKVTDCKTNLYVDQDLMWQFGEFIVCDTNVLTNIAGSTVCPSFQPGQYYACIPTDPGYCNATVVNWRDGYYALDVTSTVGNAVVTMGNLGNAADMFNATLNGATVATLSGDTQGSVTITPGATNRVTFTRVLASTPGLPGGNGATAPPAAPAPQAPAGGGGGGGGSGQTNVVVNVPAPLPGPTQSAGAKLGFVVLGGVLIVVGEPTFIPIGANVRRKPHHGATVAGIVFLAVGLIAIFYT